MIKASELTNGYNKKTELSYEYEKSLENEQFKKFVNKFNLPKEEMMKHTSNLEESTIEYNNCLNCSGLMECLNKIRGYTYLPKVVNNTLVFRYKACHYTNNKNKENNHLKYVKYYNTPVGASNASWSNIDGKYLKRKDTIRWLNDFKNNYPNVNKGLYLYGNFGCGKSYLITAMLNELAKKQVRSTIVFFSEFLQELKSSFDSDFSDKLLNVKKTPILLIDDIGAEAISAWSRDEILCPILQYRMDEKLPTFFTSNLSIDDLEQHLSFNGKEVVKAKRIIERVKQLCDVIEMNSDNMRK
ncbi:MAG: primosomal protein DnaI [Acholeplasma sp.]|jgi:primosomal protein DnaI|nr:primosomal protein DnaI [Acholeplasma sp.]